MGPVSVTQRAWFRCGGFLLAAALGTACVHLDPPVRATAEQESEREAESRSIDVAGERTGSASEACTVNFDDRAALSQVFAQARGTFASETARSPAGALVLCDPRMHSDCWTWRQHCARNDVNVENIDYSHFHLMMERGTACFGLPDPGDGYGPGFGRMVDGTCVAVDWADTERILASHARDHWIRIWVGDAGTQAPAYFDMESVWVLPGQAVQLWFRKRDGTWWFWPELPAAGVWSIGDWVRDVSEVRVTGAGSGRAAYSIGAFVIRD